MVFMFFIQDTMKRPENMMKTRCLSRPAQSKERRGISSSDLYHSQIGTMIRVGKYVFAVHQTKGLLVIDPKEDKVINMILKPEEDSNHGLGSIVLSKDGNFMG